MQDSFLRFVCTITMTNFPRPTLTATRIALLPHPLREPPGKAKSFRCTGAIPTSFCTALIGRGSCTLTRRNSTLAATRPTFLRTLCAGDARRTFSTCAAPRVAGRTDPTSRCELIFNGPCSRLHFARIALLLPGWNRTLIEITAAMVYRSYLCVKAKFSLNFLPAGAHTNWCGRSFRFTRSALSLRVDSFPQAFAKRIGFPRDLAHSQRGLSRMRAGSRLPEIQSLHPRRPQNSALKKIS
jgi:hypothetical protein